MDEIILKAFKNSSNVKKEEDFARDFTDKEINLCFVSKGSAKTDGKNIYINPGMLNLYSKQYVLFRTCKYLGIKETPSESPLIALKILTRALNIHECLHILYTKFPCKVCDWNEIHNKTEYEVLFSIFNLIEDSFIENVASSNFGNIVFYLKFCNLAINFNSINKNHFSKKIEPIYRILNFIYEYLHFPIPSGQDPGEDIKDLIDELKELLYLGSHASTTERRYYYCREIFKLIKHLIPKEKLDWSKLLFSKEDMDCSDPNVPENKPIISEVVIIQELFENSKEDNSSDFNRILDKLEKDKNKEIDKGDVININSEDFKLYFPKSEQMGLHKDITIHVQKPGLTSKAREKYKKIVKENRFIINKFKNRLNNILLSQTEVIESGYPFGISISSKKFSDPKKRYWERKIIDTNPPDLTILILLDGSGSMEGEKYDQTERMAVILNEILNASQIPHAFVEHRANFFKPEITIKILSDFNSSPLQKYKLCMGDAYGDNRDGLALYWCERYLNNQPNEEKLLITLSDGYPAHNVDDYFPPVSIADTKEAVKFIRKRGIKVIGIGLDIDDKESEDYLRAIYPNLVFCDDPEKLTSLLFRLISRELKMNHF